VQIIVVRRDRSGLGAHSPPRVCVVGAPPPPPNVTSLLSESVVRRRSSCLFGAPSRRISLLALLLPTAAAASGAVAHPSHDGPEQIQGRSFAAGQPRAASDGCWQLQPAAMTAPSLLPSFRPASASYCPAAPGYVRKRPRTPADANCCQADPPVAPIAAQPQPSYSPADPPATAQIARSCPSNGPFTAVRMAPRAVASHCPATASYRTVSAGRQLVCSWVAAVRDPALSGP